MHVDPPAVSLVHPPISIIDVAICMPELPATMRLVVPPLPFVLSAVRPDLDSIAVSHLGLPLPTVDCTVVKDMLFLESDLRC